MYDFIIVGVTFPGLLLGAMLVQRGKRVLLLERQRVAGGRISPWQREGYLSLQGIPSELSDQGFQQERALSGSDPERAYLLNLRVGVVDSCLV